MTYDVVALTERAPDKLTLAACMAHMDPGLRVRSAGGGAVVQLCDDDGEPLLSIEAAQRVEVEGEVERLLGPESTQGLSVPYWWVEARASREGERPAALARAFAEELVRLLGGRVWCERPVSPEGGR
ncbi:hypothetical protein [Actinomadura sp. 9N215]|uniref:hypothetical protein n=1 Tax=Actinomadura sp. 9N215 TaxID=3375150 RepID=UPI0037B478B9